MQYFQPIQGIVNTGQNTIFAHGANGANDERTGLITCGLRRSNNSESWGFRLLGGKDRGIPFQLVKVGGDF